LIRVDPTYSSWILTRYEPDDEIRVRSRLAVGRVTIEKEIPVYFRKPVSSKSPSSNQRERQIPQPPEVSESNSDEQIETLIEADDTDNSLPDSSLTTTPVPEPAIDSRPEKTEKTGPASEDASNAQDESEPVEVESEVTNAPAVEEPLDVVAERVDPLLEEKPRISPQELANLAPPPSALYQEFEGFLRLVPLEDDLEDRFAYELQTKSGKRIVYVDIRELKKSSVEKYVDQWIHIRGDLTETDPDFTLYLEAQNIWISP